MLGIGYDDLESIRERALRASSGGLDFGLLFLGFSLFLIAAALVLVGLLVRLGLDRLANRPAAALPYGQKRALEIGLTLALRPRLLLLDEPTAGLSLEDVARIVEPIRQVARSRTVVLVEHNMGVVAALSQRITVLTRGRVLAEGTYAELRARRDVIEAYLGGAA